MRLSFSKRVKLSQEVDADFDLQDKKIKTSLPAFPPVDFDIGKWQSRDLKCCRNTLGVITALQRLGYEINKEEPK